MLEQPENHVFRPIYDFEVDVTGVMGDLPRIIDAVNEAMRQNGVPKADMDEFNSLLEGDYDHILRVVLTWVHLIHAS